jgi:glycosyltransferase involved in cell wall biosynthesis
MRLRIAIIHDMLYPYTVGGAEKRYWEVATRLAKEHEVHMYSMQWPGMNKEMRLNDVTIHAICKPSGKVYTSKDKRTLINPILFALALLPKLAKEKFDVIDCNNSPFFHYFSVRLVTIGRNIPIVATFHEVWGDYWYEYFKNRFLGCIGKNIEKVVLFNANKVLVLSQKYKRVCVNLGISQNRVEIIPNGVDLNCIASIEAVLKNRMLFTLDD